MKKRLSAILLALCMVLSMTPTIALADGSAATAHSHCICGATHTNVGDHTTDQSASITWTAWTSSNSMPTESGYYYLTDDVVLPNDQQWKIVGTDESNTASVTICLNGHIITANNANVDDSICIDQFGTLTIMDCKGNGKITGNNTTDSLQYKHAFRVYAKGTLNMYGGTITGINTGKSYGGGLYNQGGTFNMYGGKITNNRAANGGGLFNHGGTFNMYGGEISGNSKTSTAPDGSDVHNFSSSVINTYGGKIEGAVFNDDSNITTTSSDYTGTVFNGNVTNSGTISGGIFNGTVTNTSQGTIAGSGSIVNNGMLVFQNGSKLGDETVSRDNISTLLRDSSFSGSGYVLVKGSGSAADARFYNSGETLNMIDGNFNLSSTTASDTTHWDDTNGGYKWEVETGTSTLTLKNTVVTGTLTLPDNTVIVLNGSARINRIEGNGKLTIQKAADAASGTLTVPSGIRTNNGHVTIQNGADVTVSSGTSASRACLFGLYAGNGLTVTGEGTKLTATGERYDSNSDEVQSYGIYVPAGAVMISDGSKVEAISGNTTINSGNANYSSSHNAYSYGLYMNGSLTVSGAATQLTARSGNTKTDVNCNAASRAGGGSGAFSIGIYLGGAMTVTDGTVQANGGAAQSTGSAGGAYSYGIYANGSDISISGGKLTAISGNATANNNSYSEAYSIGILGGDMTINGGKIYANGGKPTCDADATQANYGGAYSYGIYANNLSVEKTDESSMSAKNESNGNGAAVYIKNSGALTLGGTMEIEMPADGTVGTATVPVEGTDETYHTIVTNNAAAQNVSFKDNTATTKNSSHRPSYSINTSMTKNGSVTASQENAKKGTTVTLTVTPDAGYTLETLTVTDNNGNKLELTANGNGKYTFKMPAGKVTVKATFMEDNSMLNFFVDVTADKYYYNAVMWAANSGITGGINDTHFAPDLNCTRAQAVTFLYRAAGCPKPQTKDMPFTDIDENNYCYNAVLWAIENGIVNGTSDTTFSPNMPCTRAHIVAFMFRYAAVQGMDTATLQELVSGYNDASNVPEYSVSAFNWVLKADIVQGYNNRLMPSDDCTRAQIVTMLYRLLVE